MTVLEEIELRLYRFAQNGYLDNDYARKAKELAVEIYDICSGEKC